MEEDEAKRNSKRGLSSHTMNERVQDQEADQDLSFLCEVCKRRFTSPRALGGYNKKRKGVDSDTDDEEEENGDPSRPLPEKIFLSKKLLFGHTTKNDKRMKKMKSVDGDDSLVSADHEKDEKDDSAQKGDVLKIPIGYQFMPTDEQLITHFLARKLSKQVLPFNTFKEVNLYEYTPEKLEEKYGARREKEMYFLTKNKLKYANGSRVDRTAFEGFWRASSNKLIRDGNGGVIGKRLLLNYRKNIDKTIDTGWLMYEYTIPSISKKMDDYALCKVYNTKNVRINNSLTGLLDLSRSADETSVVNDKDGDDGGKHDVSAQRGDSKEVLDFDLNDLPPSEE